MPGPPMVQCRPKYIKEAFEESFKMLSSEDINDPDQFVSIHLTTDRKTRLFESNIVNPFVQSSIFGI